MMQRKSLIRVYPYERAKKYPIRVVSGLLAYAIRNGDPNGNLLRKGGNVCR